jgi:hypothetical protein
MDKTSKTPFRGQELPSKVTNLEKNGWDVWTWDVETKKFRHR